MEPARWGARLGGGTVVPRRLREWTEKANFVVDASAKGLTLSTSVDRREMSGGRDHSDETAALSFIGSKLGSYELVELLGEGGMGWVYLARHATIGRRVAIKMLRPELANHPIALSRFFAEAHVVNRISHENIVEIYDFVSGTDGPAYLVVEPLDGRDLLSSMHAGVRMPLERALAIMIQVARALGAAHAAGVVHRDLKPENIFLTRRGDQDDFVKLVDFGIAKLRNTQTSTRLTQVGTSLGTPAYISPEQALGAEVDHRTDIYSFGVILYELAAGILPFASNSVADMVSRHVLEQPKRPREIDPARNDIPRALEDLIMQCLAKQPDDRPASMAEIEETLEQVRATLGKLVVMPVRAELAPAPEAAVPPRRRRSILGPVLFAVVSAAAIGAFALMGLWRDGGQPELGTSAEASRAEPPVDPVPPPPAGRADPMAAPEPAEEMEPGTAPASAEPAAPDEARDSEPARRRVARKIPARRPRSAPVAAPSVARTPPLAPSAPDAAPAPEVAASAPPAAESPRPPATRPPVATLPPAPRPVDRGSLDAIPSIGPVSAAGLPRAEIEGALERVADSLRGCYRAAARKAGKTPAVTLTVSFEIDEGGAARDVRVGGDTLGLSGCVAGAVGSVRSRVRPDVGQARAVATVRFQPTR